MHRFVLPLCLLLAIFDLRVDAARAEACVRVRATPARAATWCLRPAPLASRLAPALGATVHALAPARDAPGPSS